MKHYFCIFLFIFSLSCKPNKNPWPTKAKEKQPEIIVKLLPLGSIDEKTQKSILADLQKPIKKVQLLPPVEMPASSYFAPRKRYRADTLIKWMSNLAKPNEVYIGITQLDISTTKAANPDYGIMGLGYCPGNACVSSTFRLRNKKNFFKVVIHELAHTTGLHHCINKTCFMRDAEGRDPTNEENEFCNDCATFLRSKGWQL